MSEYIERLECPVPGHGSWQIRLSDSDVPRCGRYPNGEMCKRELVPVRYVPEVESSSDNRTVPLVGSQAAYTRLMLERDDARTEAERLREALRQILAVNADDLPTPGEAETAMARIAHDALNAAKES